MPAEPKKTRKVLVVHGVQVGANSDQDQHKKIQELIKNRMGSLPLKYNSELYQYEDINDKAIGKAKNLMDLIGKVKLDVKLTSAILDVVGDVVISLSDNSTAEKIRQGLRNRILSYFEKGNPCYIVAHSLGSIYTFDVINDLLADQNFFDRGSRRTWPVQGLLTIGSPIGLNLFRKNRKKVLNFGQGNKFFRWLNYWDRNDPVVSGNIFGKHLSKLEIARSYMTDNPEQGWFIRDVPVDTGKIWLPSHTAYWEDVKVGDGLVDLIAH